jgi:hypothetical protein
MDTPTTLLALALLIAPALLALASHLRFRAWRRNRPI